MRNRKIPKPNNPAHEAKSTAKMITDRGQRASRTNQTARLADSYLTIHESEIRIPAGLSYHAGACETGGDLWGWYTRAGRASIQLITGPGPNAAHESAHYAQDLTFFKDLQQQLSKKFGCQWLGTWHCHHNLGLRAPSTGDVHQVMAVTKRNGLDRWCEFITTFDSDEIRTPLAYRYGRSLPMHHTNNIRIDAYDYPDPQTGQLVNTRIRVLPGISPLRLALLHTRTVDQQALAEEGILFPLSHILFDPYEEDTTCTESDESLEALSRQCAELPAKLQESMQFDIENHTLSVSIQLPRGSVMVAHYARTIPLKLEAVSLEEGETGRKRDITRVIKKLGRRLTLRQLCEFVSKSIVKTGNRCLPG